MNELNCPHCGTESVNIALASMPPKYPFKCGSYEGYRSPMCKEKEEQKIKEECEASDTPETEINIIEDRICLVDGTQKWMQLVDAKFARKLERERDEAITWLRVAAGLLATEPQFENKHPEEVLEFLKEGAK